MLVGGVVVSIYFVLIFIMLQHRTHACMSRHYNMAWKDKMRKVAPGILFERSEFLIATSPPKNLSAFD